MTIFSVGFGLNSVIVSRCMMLPRLADGVLDPIVGHWSDNLHTRWGRRKPFLVGGAFLGAIFLALLWWADPGWSPTAQFLHLGIVGTLPLPLLRGVRDGMDGHRLRTERRLS